MNWSKVLYVPQAKWKFGERTAIGNLRGWRSDAVCPLFKLVPPGDYDPEIDATITPEMYLRLFGGQLAEARGRRPAILDGSAIELLKNGETEGLLFAELLERARLVGAHPIPLISLSSSPAYRDAAVRFANRASTGAVCLRIDVGELEFVDGRLELIQLASGLGLQPANCVLLIDGGSLNIADTDDFASLLSNQINRLIQDGDWATVVWSAGSFPEKDGLRANQSGAFERDEWKLYRAMFDYSDQFAVFPVYSDYLLEYPRSKMLKGVSPTAKILYSTENKYFVFKGQSVRIERKYGNIFGVARRVVESGVFKGEGFSTGDARIKLLAQEQGTSGHAGTWRWIASSHHLELVVGQLDALFGLGMLDERVSVEPDQMRLV